MSDPRTIEQRFARLEAFDLELLAVIERTDDRLRAIAAQNEATAEMALLLGSSIASLEERLHSIAEVIEMLGRYVNTAADHLQQHETDPNAHGGEHDAH